MSIRTVSPFVPGSTTLHLRTILSELVSGVPACDAPSFYGDITMRLYGSGSRAYTSSGVTTTQSISYDESKTFTRIPINQDCTYSATFYFDDGKYDRFFYDTPAASDCLVLWQVGKQYGIVPSIGEHHLKLVYADYITDLVIGTESYSDGSPSADIVSDLLFEPPIWGFAAGSPAYGETWDTLKIYAGHGTMLDFVDLGVTPSRDIRGTYTASFNDDDIDPTWDTNTVVHSVALTIS